MASGEQTESKRGLRLAAEQGSWRRDVDDGYGDWWSGSFFDLEVEGMCAQPPPLPTASD